LFREDGHSRPQSQDKLLPQREVHGFQSQDDIVTQPKGIAKTHRNGVGLLEVACVDMDEELSAYLLDRLHEAETAIVETQNRIGDNPENEHARRLVEVDFD
jgi:hypothetical protein